MKHSCAVFFFVFILLTVPAAIPATVKKNVPPKKTDSIWVNLMNPSSWKMTPTNSALWMWSRSDTAFEGTDSWVGFEDKAGDFIFEGDFIFMGKTPGGIVLRGNRDSWIPLTSGYGMEITGAGKGNYGSARFTTFPQPNPPGYRFPIGKWQRFSIKAVGPKITVTLNGLKAIEFTDDRFRYGHVCLGGGPEGVKYRKLRLRKLDARPPAGTRTAWVDLFDGASLDKWDTTGQVLVSNGVLVLDGRTGRAEARPKARLFTNGIVELDVYRQPGETSPGSYSVALRAGKSNDGTCFTFRPTALTPCDTSLTDARKSSSFASVDRPEYWRFELSGTKITVSRFGAKIRVQTQCALKSGTVSIAADSCLVQVRNVYYSATGKISPASRK